MIQDLLELARSRVFSIGPCDTSARLAEDQAAYGLARAMYALKKSGLDDSGAYVLFSPDASITRNRARWDAGYGYGCLVRFQQPDPQARVFFPEVRPNACGMITFKFEGEFPTWDDLSDRLVQLSRRTVVDGKKIVLNLGNSNHFVEVYEVDRSSWQGLSEGDKVGIIHTSPPEVKDGLYDLDSLRKQGGRYEETPFGPVLMLEGRCAERYFEHYDTVDQFSRRRRRVIAEELFGEVIELSNHNHQGIFPDGTVRLGLHDTSPAKHGLSEKESTSLYPVTLRWDVPVRLYEGLPNIAAELMPPELLERMQSYGVDPEGVNILPHGGGYELHEGIEYLGMGKAGDKIAYRAKTSNAEYIFTNPAELPYGYRTRGIYENIEKYQLGRCVAELNQKMTVKY